MFFPVILLHWLKHKKMENISVLKNPEVVSSKTHGTNVSWETISRRRKGFDPAIVSLISEGGVNFYRYLKSLNMSKGSDILILPSNHHYFYDEKDLKSVRVLVNLKKLNLIRHLDIFLNTLVRILPQDTNFIGCFSDSKTLKGNGFSYYHPSRLFNSFINFLDSRTDRIMDKNEVSELLGKYGFKTVDMKEMNGLTYFCCKMSGRMFN
jgi:hypothetical protein